MNARPIVALLLVLTGCVDESEAGRMTRCVNAQVELGLDMEEAIQVCE